MSNPGLGAMLHMMDGGSPKNPADYYGRKITSAKMEKKEYNVNDTDFIILELDGKTKIKVWDDGQSCCESRYMTTDDNLNDLVGKKLTAIETRDGGNAGAEYGEHEIVFLHIKAEDETIVVATHNEHNGYYGGFGLSVDEVKEALSYET